KYLSMVESSKATMVESSKEKYRKNMNFDDEIADVIFEDLCKKYGK
nr:hypothetical protein [Tanacetum cinerariifolium]